MIMYGHIILLINYTGLVFLIFFLDALFHTAIWSAYVF